jgi:L-2-hydroxyglutarate oxidase LhgO
LNTVRKDFTKKTNFLRYGFSDLSQLKEWMPLVMEGEMSQKKWLLQTSIGTDVNFGELTRSILVI